MKSGANKENYCGDEGAMSQRSPTPLFSQTPGPPGFFICWYVWVRGGSSPPLVTSCTYFLGFFLHLEKLAMSIPYLLSSAWRFPRPLSTLDDARQLALGPRLAPKSCWLLLLASRVCSCRESVITPGAKLRPLAHWHLSGGQGCSGEWGSSKQTV